MKLYKDSGTNPFASCLPILLQMPIFFALFRMLDQASKKGKAHGFLTRSWRGSSATPSSSARSRSRARSGSAPGGNATRVVMIVAAVLVRGDDRDHVHDPAPADEQEHAGRRAVRSLRPAAEDAALRPPGGLRGRRHRLPDRRARLLDGLEPLDDVPAVLRHPQQPRPRHAGRRCQGGARPREGRAQRASPRGETEPEVEPETRSPAQPQRADQGAARQTKAQRRRPAVPRPATSTPIQEAGDTREPSR